MESLSEAPFVVTGFSFMHQVLRLQGACILKNARIAHRRRRGMLLVLPMEGMLSEKPEDAAEIAISMLSDHV